MFTRRRKPQTADELGLGEVVARCRDKAEELNRLRGNGFGGVPVVIRRDLNLAKPACLLGGFLILALGVGLGRWFKDPVADSRTTNKLAPIVQTEESKPAIVPAIKLEPSANIFPIQHNSSDTLLLKVNDLLERVKRGE